VVELHSDGSAWAEMRVGHSFESGHCVLTLPELEKTAVELTAMLGGYTGWAGAAGDCAVGAWMYSGPRMFVQREGFIQDVHLPREGAETTAPVEQLAGDRVRVGQAVYPLMRDLLQDMGIAEPGALRSDGTMASS
jgi:hypothetical protein